MKKEELQSIFQEIGSLEDVTDIRAKLVDFQQSLEADYDDHEKVTKENESLVEKNKKLQENNMALFLQVTGKPEPKDETKTKRKFEDLFDEKGRIK